MRWAVTVIYVEYGVEAETQIEAIRLATELIESGESTVFSAEARKDSRLIHEPQDDWQEPVDPKL